ncbi:MULTISPECIES: DUF6113 family protein [Pseudofrankia]|uniref:DUF6113 family protein n=1 Tax=Pseudofrankia TaxID=2994363 RepID=UPI0002E65AA2|nr:MULTISPECIES: DUF6113 family protein [Pseudofrankia]OHV37875.1 hypothetical protein BCD49_15520 [Pseudofrankia sp. EUN1h]
MPRPSTGPRPPTPGASGAGGAGRLADSVAARVTGLGTSSVDQRAEPSRLFLGCAYAFGLLAGVVLGVYGVAAVPAGPRPGGTLLSLGLLLVVVGNVGVPILVRWLTGTRLGACIMLIGWTPVVLALGSTRGEGDLMLRASSTAYLFMGVGVVAPLLVAVLRPSRRGLTAFPPMP